MARLIFKNCKFTLKNKKILLIYHNKVFFFSTNDYLFLPLGLKLLKPVVSVAISSLKAKDLSPKIDQTQGTSIENSTLFETKTSRRAKIKEERVPLPAYGLL